MKKVMLVLLAVILVFALYLLLTPSKVQVPQKVVSKKVEPLIEKDEFPFLEEAEEEIEEDLTLVEINKVLLTKEIPKEMIPEIVEDERETVDIMVETTMDEVEKNFPPKEGVPAVTAIELPKKSITALNIGDTISLPYMGTGQFDAKITSKTINQSGSVTVAGNLVGSDSQYSVVLTEGKNMSFGTVTTPNGSYEIEVKNGQGYVYSTAEIDSNWINYGKEDTLVPQNPHGH